MIDFIELMEKDEEVSEAVDKIVNKRIEFDFVDLNTMDDELFEIVKPFFDDAVEKTDMSLVKNAKNPSILLKEIVSDAIPRAVESFNEDRKAVLMFLGVIFNRFQENEKTEKDAREKLINLANCDGTLEVYE